MALGQLAIVVLVAAACGSGGTTSVPPDANTVPTIADPRFGKNSPLTIVVTNQSFERPTVELVVTLNGQTAVSGKFKVEGQHDFNFYSFDVPAGSHEITVVGGEQKAQATVDVVGRQEPRWLVISYWADQIRTEKFTSYPGFG